MKKSKIKVNICPKCKKYNTLTYYAAGTTGSYKCKNCNYIGSFIIEKELEL